MSSLAVGRRLENLEHWLEGLFTASELAAADLLLRLNGDDAAAPASTSTTPSSSPRWVSPCAVHEDLAVEDEEERVVEATELDRRARKRYRLLSDLYAATIPVTSAAAAKKKRKTCDDDEHEDGGGESE